VRTVPVVEVLCHRVVWALAVLAVVTAVRGEMRAVAAALRDRRALLVLSGSTVLIAINWLVYIYSVTYARILESSLGYYINPLVSVLFGIVLLGERLTPLMKAAVVAAAGGVTWMAIDLGQLPWISLVLALSFGLYGLLRKIAPVGPLIGLTVEDDPPGAAVCRVPRVVDEARPLGLPLRRPWVQTLLLLAGPVTAVRCCVSRPRRDGFP
jgi:chloramphenicol-sensitive protein RarD